MQSYPNARGLAGVLRRFGAGCYDGLLVGGLLMVAVGIATYATRAAGTPGALSAYPFQALFSAVELAVIGGYFGWSWTRSGETLGMKAWGLRLVDARGAAVRWPVVARRLALALPLWLMPVAALFLYMAHRAPAGWAAAAALPLVISLAAAYPDGISLHDRGSGTRVLRVPRDAPVASKS